MLSRYNTFDYKLDTRLNVGFKIDEEFGLKIFSKAVIGMSLCAIPCLSFFSQSLMNMTFGGGKKKFDNTPKNLSYEMLKEKKNKIQDKVLEDDIETDDDDGVDRINTTPHKILFSLNNYKKNGVKNGY